MNEQFPNPWLSKIKQPIVLFWTRQRREGLLPKATTPRKHERKGRVSSYTLGNKLKPIHTIVIHFFFFLLFLLFLRRRPIKSSFPSLSCMFVSSLVFFAFVFAVFDELCVFCFLFLFFFTKGCIIHVPNSSSDVQRATKKSISLLFLRFNLYK